MTTMHSTPVPRDVAASATTSGRATHRARRTTGALVLAAVLAAGCAGDQQGVTDLSTPGSSPAPTAGTDSVVTTVASTTTEPPATTTDAPQTTESVPVPDPTDATEAPDDEPADEASTIESEAVIAAYLAAWQAFTDAARDPEDPELRALVESTRIGVNLERAVTILDELVLNGWVAIEHPVEQSRTAIETGPLIDGDTATVVVCDLDSNIAIEPGGAPDGSDAMVNDSVTARRLEVTLTRVDGAWKVSSGRTIAEWPEVWTCD